MNLSPRRLPWLLAFVGAMSGWAIFHFHARASTCPFFVCCARPVGESRNTAGVLLALGFGFALFLAGWLHVNRRSRGRWDLLTAAARILLCCGAIGLTPGMLFGVQSLRAGAEGAAAAILVGLMVLPSTLLLTHAHGELRAPRPGSLFASAEQAEEALAILGAVVLLPWYLSPRPNATALMLVLIALPALGIGLQAVILARHAGLLAVAFPVAAPVPSANATVICDIGFGAEERALPSRGRAAYRSHAGLEIGVCRGNLELGARAALRLAGFAFAVCVAAAAQACWLHLVRL